MDRSDPSLIETVAQPSVSSTSSSFADEGRFVPGALLAGRYRILGLLGRGFGAWQKFPSNARLI